MMKIKKCETLEDVLKVVAFQKKTGEWVPASKVLTKHKSKLFRTKTTKETDTE